jgi:hypothetical protein
MMGPPGSLARELGTNSLKTNSVRGGRAAAAATPEAAFRKNFRRVVGIGTSLVVCGALLIAEKGIGGQQNDLGLLHKCIKRRSREFPQG